VSEPSYGPPDFVRRLEEFKNGLKQDISSCYPLDTTFWQERIAAVAPTRSLTNRRGLAQRLTLIPKRDAEKLFEIFGSPRFDQTGMPPLAEGYRGLARFRSMTIPHFPTGDSLLSLDRRLGAPLFCDAIEEATNPPNPPALTCTPT
jgi:hypothetical protein